MSVIRDLIDKLNYYTKLYEEGNPIISDREWDNLYFKLIEEENRTGITYPDSPTQSIYYEVVSELKKVKHNHPMLSLDKTKDFNNIISFIGTKDWIAMAKMDGLTCSLKYENGCLVGAETRGNGLEGEDVLHNARLIASIPQTIPCIEDIIIDGEIICTYDNFRHFSETYKNPRNFASGSIRLLNPYECKSRNLTFVAWDFVKGSTHNTLVNRLLQLEEYGFTIVPFVHNLTTFLKEEEILDNILKKAEKFSYPIDGIVFKYNNVEEYEAAGRTDHHFKGGLAYKLYDETYSTKLNYISWTMGRTGVLTPVAIFDPIDIEGSTIKQASLHNVSIMHELLGECPYVGEPLEIYKANQIIPQVSSANPKYNYADVLLNHYSPLSDIETCPICGGAIEYNNNEGVINAYCSNSSCEGKLINKLDHFAGKKGLDIKGLSKATFEKLIDWGWINNLSDIFNLEQHKHEWINKAGFGKASVEKILKSIEDHKNTSLENFISAIGIPLIGKVNAQQLVKYFSTYEEFKNAVNDEKYNFENIYGFGYEMNNSLKTFDYTEADHIAKFLIFNQIIENNVQKILQDKIIVITGKLQLFKNREELISLIEKYGGKVTSSISLRTSLLINNDINSTSSKNIFAKQHNIPIVSEQQFINEYIENT